MIKSSPKKYGQIQLTKLLAEQAKAKLASTESWHSIRQVIWFNPTEDSSLRLTHSGYNFFKKLGYKGYEINLEQQGLVNKHLLILERHFPGVYMLVNAKKIILFDEEYASLIILMNNDLVRYLETLVQSSVDQ